MRGWGLGVGQGGDVLRKFLEQEVRGWGVGKGTGGHWGDGLSRSLERKVRG